MTSDPLFRQLARALLVSGAVCFVLELALAGRCAVLWARPRWR